MLTKEDLKAIEKILSPRFDALEKRIREIYIELDRRICCIVDSVGEINATLQGLALLDANSGGDIKRQDGNIQEVYKMSIEVNDRLDAIERHLDTKYDPVSRNLMDKSKIDYDRKRLKG